MNYIISFISRNIFTHSSMLLYELFHSIYDKYDLIMNSNIRSIKTYQFELEKTDIKNKLSSILSILKIIIHKYNNIIDDNTNDDYEIIDYEHLLINCPDILKNSIISLLDIIHKINNNLDIIHKKINNYNQSYLKLLYNITIDNYIQQINLYNKIFNDRIYLFFKLIKFYDIKLN